MRTGMVAAGVTAFRLAFFNYGAEYRNLFYNIFASAVRAFLFAGIRGFFKQLKIVSTLLAFIFKNRHIFFLFTSRLSKKIIALFR
jgi:hypothetical protein